MAFGKNRETKLDRFIQKRRFRRLAHLIPEGAVVADLGCGFNAPFLQSVAPLIQKGFGFDFEVNPECPAINLQLQPAPIDGPLPLPAESVDIVTCLAVIEHVVKPEVLLSETFRILKPKGRFICTTPSKMAKPILEFLAFKLNIIDRAEIADHKRYFNKTELTRQITTAGFFPDDIDVRYFQLGCNIFGMATKP